MAEALFGAEGKGGRVASVVDPSRAVRLDTEAQRFVDRNKQRRAIIITGAVALAVLVIVIATTRGDGKSSPRAPGDDRLATSSSPGTDSVTKTPDTSATSPGPDTTKTSAGTTASDPAGARAGVQTDAGEDRNATSEAAGITGTPGGDTETVATNPVKAGEPEIATDDRSTATTDEVPVDNPRSGGSRGQTPRASASTLYNQGFDYFVKGRLGPARDKFRASLRVNPRYAQAHRGLGLVYERMGNKKQAAKAYREYLRLAPRAGDAETIRRKLAALGG